MKKILVSVCVAATALLAACGERDRPVAPPIAPVASASPTNDWIGKWSGPEGTFLLVERAADRYRITVQNLDGPRVFEGIAVGEAIRFERDGVAESVHATDGAATGMKWLADKRDCLTVRAGEGYCRDSDP